MSEDALLHCLQEFVKKHKLFENGEKIIAAVSGGIDSMVLLDALHRLSERMSLKVAVAHFNHQLRQAESDADESFVLESAKERGLECYIERANIEAASEAKKISIQEAAREARYEFLTKLRRSLGFQKIATAHHADDNTETILFNLFRGAGVHGLSGIPVMRSDLCVIRPLIFATRERIENYAATRNIRYREDSTNSDSHYTRNFLRNKLIPMIRENVNPNLTATLLRTSELFDQLEDYLEDAAAAAVREAVSERSSQKLVIDLKVLHGKPLFLQEHILMQLGRDFLSSYLDFNSVKTLLNISSAETGSSASISKDAVAYRNRNNLVLMHFTRRPPFRYSIELNKSYGFGNFSFASEPVMDANLSGDPNVEFIDGDKVSQNLIIRNWSEGDWFVPLGMKDKKKLSDFFIDEKVPLFEKQGVPILLSDDLIVWICGKRLDERFKITPKTRNIIKLEFIPDIGKSE